jgi:hypothetical protein
VFVTNRLFLTQTTDRPILYAKSKNGEVVEVLEWKDKVRAHAVASSRIPASKTTDNFKS